MQIDSNVSVVVAPDCLPVEYHAAEELTRYLKEMTGLELPIVRKPTASGPNIYIGSAAPVAGLNLSETTLDFDGYLVKTVGNDLVLTGIKPYSCLYAVYHLLERHLGCGFFQDGDQVPHRRTIRIEKLNDVEKPRFEWRILAVFHTPSYSGMRWNDSQEWKQYFDWAIKKRFNMCVTNWLSTYTGIVALAAGKLGVKIELTDWQKKNIALLRRVFDHARICGMRFVYMTDYCKPELSSDPGSSAYYDTLQIQEFVRRYQELTGKKIPQYPYYHNGFTFQWMDPRDPETQKFLTACVEASREALGPDDHLYAVDMTSEGAFGSGSPEEQNEITYSMLMDTIKAVKAADPEAVIYTPPPFAYAKTYATQKKALQDAGLAIMADFWLHIPARTPDFKMNDYYWGLPWSTGMIVGCGKHTNPCADMNTAIDHARQLAADPRANKCKGFFSAGEFNHRQYIWLDLHCVLAWNPTTFDRDEFLRLWTQRRYGPDAVGTLHTATLAAADSLLSHENMDMTNRPLYRDWNGGYLPGLTATSVRRTLSYLPKMRIILETLLSKHEQLKDSELYRFDLVDYGRTYLGAIFNDRLARARKALRAKDKAGFEKAAAAVDEVMHFMARYVSAHRLFRLKTHDDRAKRHPQILPGHDNTQSNWVTFTVTQSLRAWQVLLDYTAEDYAELVEHYYWPRVKLYLSNMRKLIDKGKDISENTGLKFRISDWAPPRGNLPWSPYGPPVEAELKGGDMELAHNIIFGESVSGRFDFYEGPMEPLVQELLKRFPVPGDLKDILTEPDPTDAAFKKHSSLTGKPGDTLTGFCTADIVEQVNVPKEVTYVVKIEEVDQTHILQRGEVKTYKVQVSDWVTLTRREDEKSEHGGHSIAIFEFDFGEKQWVMRYDPGSEQTFASLSIVPVKN